MKISIVTVCFNSEKTIEDTIKSVISQTYFPFVEYVIIDGLSCDRTLELINKYSKHLKFVVSERDMGIYDAMNKGIQAANGDVIGILNSDDLYFDQYVLEEVAKSFDQDKDLDFLYGDIVYVKQVDTSKIVRKWVSKRYFPKFFDYGNVPPHPALFIRKRVIEKVGLFNLDFKFAADYEYMLRLFKKYNFNTKYINRFIVKMRLGGATNKSLRNIFKGNVEIYKAWKFNGFSMPLYFFPIKLFKRLIQFV